jgi:ABC-type transport system involved in multi-copper enzyme maturation permease subunit
MPIHDRAYLRMPDRDASGRAPRFLAISRYGARYQRRTRLFWFCVVGCWIPALVWIAAIYSAEETGRLEAIPLERISAMAPNEYRRLTADYAIVLLQVQGFFATFMAALAGGGAIAEDSRRHAFELYFSRPISWRTYLAGKWAFVFSRLLLALLYPLLAVAIVACMFIPDMLTVCWPVIAAAAGSAVFMSACYALVVLGVSSTVRSTRYAIVFWFILAFFTVVISLVLVRISGDARFEAVSFRFAIEHVASWIVGAELEALPFVDVSERSVALSAVALSGWLALASLLLVKRLRRASGIQA